MATWTPPADAVETSTDWVPPADAVETSAPAAPKPAYQPTFAENLTGGLIEPVMKLGSSLIAKPVSDVAGIAAMFSDYLGNKQGDPLGFKKHVQESLTYQPRTTAGQSEYNPLNAIPEVIGKGINAVTTPVMSALRGDAAADTPRGMAANLFGEAVPQALGFAGVKSAPAVSTGAKTVIRETVSDFAKSRQFGKEQAVQAASDTDWQRAALIDAANTARKNNIVINPAISNPTLANKTRVVATGGSDVFDTAASIANKNRWNDMARDALGVGKNTQLTEATYKQALKNVAAPYEKASELGVLKPVSEVIEALKKIDVPEILPAGEVSAGKVARRSDQIVGKIENGMTGEEALKTVKDLYREAKLITDQINSGKNVGTVALDNRNALRTAAKKMEDLIAENISDPTWRKSFVESRQKMAEIYALKDATNLATRQIDPMVFANEMAGPNFLTGKAKEMGEIAANMPTIANIHAKSGMVMKVPSRSGPAGTIGYSIGTGFGEAIPMSTLAAVVSNLGGMRYAKGLMTKEAQKTLASPMDRRLPQPGLLTGEQP
jgi:hypothetical protein